MTRIEDFEKETRKKLKAKKAEETKKTNEEMATKKILRIMHLKITIKRATTSITYYLNTYTR